MATPIKIIPVLKGSEAKRFNDKAKAASKNKHSVDFREQVKATKDILAKMRIV